MKILVLGSTGLLGHALMRSLRDQYDVTGTIRGKNNLTTTNVIEVKDLTNPHELRLCFDKVNPDVVINCLSLKDINAASLLKLKEIFVNVPHYISSLCEIQGSKFINISSDGVFSGERGNYSEDDLPDPIDNYGYCKLMGETIGINDLVIRTSMIGHSFNRSQGLIDWFVKQKECTLFKNVFFSGLTTNELAKVIKNFVLQNQDINGLYHIAASPISKFELLSHVQKIYNLDIQINIDEQNRSNRSLDSKKFSKLTGYIAPSWECMINTMKEERLSHE